MGVAQALLALCGQVMHSPQNMFPPLNLRGSAWERTRNRDLHTTAGLPAQGAARQTLVIWCEASLASAPACVQETEKRLKDIVAGKRQAGPLAVANGAARKGPAGKQRQTMLVFTVRRRQAEDSLFCEPR